MPITDAHAADWFRQADVDVWSKILFGPPGYDAYVRVQLVNHDERPGFADPAMPAVIETLTTAGPNAGQVFVGLWDGYGMFVPPGPRFDVYEDRTHRSSEHAIRSYVLLAAPLGDLFRPGTIWPDEQSVFHEPHLVWPADRAWFIAADVDPEWFTVGTSSSVADALIADPRLDAELVPYGARTIRGEDW